MPDSHSMCPELHPAWPGLSWHLPAGANPEVGQEKVGQGWGLQGNHQRVMLCFSFRSWVSEA